MWRDPDVVTAYKQTLKEYLDNSITEEIDKGNGNKGKIWYVQHRVVVRKGNSTTKYGIVFDGSARCKEPGVMMAEQMSGESSPREDEPMQCMLATGISAVKRVLRRCVICIKENSRLVIMGPLTKERLVETYAFDNVGIDFAGPLYVKERKTIAKAYICLFTCMSARANTFICARCDWQKLFGSVLPFFTTRENIEKKGKEEDVKWRFSYRRAPWCGGYWERLERSVKTSLRRVLAKALVTRE
ncbi:hypothetical protein T01_3400 [Trichinella spiralis]|uniref:Uncharacterized protein n=1 Tax=Trichinella spiralis TaxID=6334 RepID=A0A0V1BW89_TRISP|nr:hypothetical protein T01_3400 [Trichinella spiralis]